MDEDVSDSQKPCEVCGTMKRVIREGYFYCMECGIRCADTHQVMDYGDEFLQGTKIIRKTAVVKNELGSVWSSWHGYNIILCGLTGELGSCSLKGDELKQSALKLWGTYLGNNRIAFYSSEINPKFPKFTYNVTKKDLEYMYGFKKKKTKHIRKKKTITKCSERLKQKRKHLLITKHFKSLSQKSNNPSQTLSQLANIDTEKPSKILIQHRGLSLLNKSMSKAKIDEHLTTGYCSTTCKCLLKKPKSTMDKRHYFSIFNLYVILVLALRINDDEIHIGDVIRWCREGHISYAKYKHFFPEDLVFKKGDPLFTFTPIGLSHKILRQTAGVFSRFLNLKIMKAPDIKMLIERYLKELELPRELIDYILRLVEALGPLPHYQPADGLSFPNYEGIALAYIIITLKMIFGLDDVTESMISSQSVSINEILSLEKIEKRINVEDVYNYEKNEPKLKPLFIWKSWTKYIEYRKICLSEYHYPTRVRLYPDDCDKPELFLHHQKITKRDYEPEHVIKNKNHLLMKSILEDIQLENDDDDSFPTFPCSLYPMSSCVEHLLMIKPNSSSFNRKILTEDFTSCNISFLFHPKDIQAKLKKKKINLNIHPFRGRKTKVIPWGEFIVDKDNKNIEMASKFDVKINNCTSAKWESVLLSETISKIIMEKYTKISDEMSKISVTAHDLQKKIPSDDVAAKPKFKNRKNIYLNICHSDYWIRHYNNMTKFTQTSFDKELLNHFPRNFRWLLKECAETAELSSLELYKEVVILEKKLIELNKNETSSLSS